MPVTDIKEIRILQALAVGRFGSSPDPMDNYEVQVDENDPTEFQKIVPAETLIVDAQWRARPANNKASRLYRSRRKTSRLFCDGR